jgi:hypothetical protein
MPSNMSRRSVVGLLGAGGVASLLVSRLEDAPAAGSATASDQTLQVGTQFGRWVITAVTPVSGAIRVGVAGSDGQAFELEVLARDASPLAARPPAQTEGLAIYVSNGGDGWSSTAEEQGLAAMTLATLLTARGHGGAIAGLLTHGERIVRHNEAMMTGPTFDPAFV